MSLKEVGVLVVRPALARWGAIAVQFHLEATLAARASQFDIPAPGVLYRDRLDQGVPHAAALKHFRPNTGDELLDGLQVGGLGGLRAYGP
jgi:hypothetical protein